MSIWLKERHPKKANPVYFRFKVTFKFAQKIVIFLAYKWNFLNNGCAREQDSAAA